MGTNSPSDRLHVDGNIRINKGSTTFNGNFGRQVLSADNTVDYGYRMLHYLGTEGVYDAMISVGGSGTSQGKIQFFTTDDFTGDANIPTLTILPNGNVGVGHAEPGYPFTVQSNDDARAIRIVGRASDNRGTFQFVNSTQGTIKGIIQADDNYLKIRGNSSLSADSIHILPDGNIGLGTGVAESKVHISSGNTLLKGTNYDNGLNLCLWF